MRITAAMVAAFKDSNGAGFAAEMEVREALGVVAPMIGEQAQAGYIEQGHQLRQARDLIRRARDVVEWENVDPKLAADLTEFLDPIDFPAVPDPHES